MLPETLQVCPSLDSWISFNKDGVVTVFSGKVEIGQRVTSALSTIVSSELGVDVLRVAVTCADTELTPDEGYTAASCSMELSGSAIRYVAAAAKRKLLSMAAAKFSCDVQELTVNDGTISNHSGTSAVTYWDLVGDTGFECDVSDSIVKTKGSIERDSSDKLSYQRSLGIATGEFEYIQDHDRPNMLHGRVIRPPNYHARLESVDVAAVKSMAGVNRVVQNGSFLAVIAETEYQAVKASSRLENSIKWKQEVDISVVDISEQLLEGPKRSVMVTEDLNTDGNRPDVSSDPRSRKLRARYQRPYLMHGSIGPSCAIALFERNQLQVWTHSQGVYPLRNALSFVLKIDTQNIRVIHLPGAGCYGHNGADDAALDAALLARECNGVPVRLSWSRKDEHCWEPYGSAMLVDLEAGVDKNNDIVFWNYDVYSDAHVKRPGPNSDGSHLLASWHLEAPHSQPETTVPWNDIYLGIGFNAVPIYNIPNRNINLHRVEPLPLRVSALRSLGAYTNVFAIESFVDELAEAASEDPLEFRLRHLTDDRAKELLQRVCREADWYERRQEENIGMGVGFARYDNHRSYAVVCASVEIDEQGAVHCREAVLGGDAGEIIDPAGFRCQLEGGFIQSLSWSLNEEVLYDSKGITSQDWDTYKILSYSQVPKIKTILLDRPGMPFLGCGETMQGPTVAALANAVFNAIGVRLRQTPFTPERLQSAAWETGV